MSQHEYQPELNYTSNSLSRKFFGKLARPCSNEDKKKVRGKKKAIAQIESELGELISKERESVNSDERRRVEVRLIIQISAGKD